MKNCKQTVPGYFILVFLLTWSVSAISAEAAKTQVLIKNVNIFDGSSEKLAMNQDELVEGNLIKQIGKEIKAANNATVIEGNVKTLIPGRMMV